MAYLFKNQILERQNRKERPNRSTNNGVMAGEVKRCVSMGYLSNNREAELLIISTQHKLVYYQIIKNKFLILYPSTLQNWQVCESALFFIQSFSFWHKTLLALLFSRIVFNFTQYRSWKTKFALIELNQIGIWCTFW